MPRFIPPLGGNTFLGLTDTPSSYAGKAYHYVRVKPTEDGLYFWTGWLPGWQYRKRITIAGSTGAGANYQVLLKVGESSGSTGAHFHLEGHSANFPSGENRGGDLRFCADDGATLLNFWVEKVEGTSPNRVAYIWVKVADDLGSNRDIYCYYGNSSASNYSNGDNTFIFFDDFNDNSLNPNKWTATTGIAEQNQRLEVTVDQNGTIWVAANTVPAFTPPFIVEVKATTGVVDTTSWVLHMGEDAVGTSYGYGFGIYAGNWNYPVANGGPGTWTNPPTPASYTTYRLKEVLTSTNSKAYINGVQYGSKTFNTPITTAIRYGLGTMNNLPYYDNFFIRKYADPEPAFLSAGAEEVA